MTPAEWLATIFSFLAFVVSVASFVRTRKQNELQNKQVDLQHQLSKIDTEINKRLLVIEEERHAETKEIKLNPSITKVDEPNIYSLTITNNSSFEVEDVDVQVIADGVKSPVTNNPFPTSLIAGQAMSLQLQFRDTPGPPVTINLSWKDLEGSNQQRRLTVTR